MSHFPEEPRDGAQEPSGHDVEQATIEVSQPYWAETADETAEGSWCEEHAGSGSGESFDGEPSGSRPGVGARMTHFRERVRDALAGVELGAPARPAVDPEATRPFDVLADVPAEEDGTTPTARFAVAPLGYSRTAVDEHIAALERELAELRAPGAGETPPVSITEEIERLGEQTASILIVAHDQAHETTRLAQEQAERCVSEANDSAVSITEQARRRLESLDLDTDVVWQERAKLLDDARAVAGELVALVQRAHERFPEELKKADVQG